MTTWKILLCAGLLNSISVASDQPTKLPTENIDEFVPLKDLRDTQNEVGKVDAKDYAFKNTLRQALLGDIDNDGKDELIAFTQVPQPPTEEGFHCISLHLVIYKIEPKGLRLLWTDHGTLEYSGCPEIEAVQDELLFAPDVENVGHNELMISRGLSDVSAMRYDVYVWDKSRKALILQAKDVRFENENIVWAKSQKVIGGFLISMRPVVQGGKQIMQAAIWGMHKSTETLNGQNDVLDSAPKKAFGTIKGTKFVVSKLE